jgi:hypothetical protein
MTIFQDNQISKLLKSIVFRSHKKYLKKLTNLLNKDRMIILSWHHKSWKLSFIKDFLLKTKLDNKVFFFHKDFLVWEVINWKMLIDQLNESLKYNNNIKLILLSDFNKIPGIKDFIQYIYNHQNKFKVILIWNTIQIPWIPEIEYLPEIGNEINNFIISHWVLPEIIHSKNNNLARNYLDLIVSDMYTKEIFIPFSIKDIEMYQLTMTYVSKIDNHISLRELQKWLSEIQQITLKTTIDYINFSLRAKIIKPVHKYDFKKQKVISSRIKYYFTNNGIRNSISKYSLSHYQLKENLLYQLLTYNWYKVYSGLNGTFDFIFYCSSEEDNICLHYSQVTEKSELKKEINKLNKVPVDWKKYIVLDSIENLWIKKLIYDDVEIIEYQNIFHKLQAK